ncbi:MAG: winged helix-turn-helix domain-containing protein [Parachlamydiales bacterium]
MLEALFGTSTIERILLFLFANDKTYASEISKRFHCSLTAMQNGLDRLEAGGIIVGFPIGRTRIYQFNPRYPFLTELKALLATAYQALPDSVRATLYEPPIRRRPRKRNKPL